MTRDDVLDVADVLDKAADILAPKGAWGRGERLRYREIMCAATAIDFAAGGTPSCLATAAHEALAEELGLEHGYGLDEAIYEWNDAQRDKRKVQRALRRTARKLRGASR